MLENNKKLKNSLEKAYRTVMAIPENGIGFDFFVLLADYVKFIDRSEYLRKLFYESNYFNNSNPHNLLIERGRSVSDLNRVFKDKKSSNIFIAYFNLYAVYTGIEDLDYGLENNVLAENRLKMVEHLKNIRDREKIVGPGFFWFNRKKYREWLRAIHKCIMELLELEEEKEEDSTIKQENKSLTGDIGYRCDTDNQLAWFVFNDKEMEFKGKRAIVFNFFYSLNKIGDEDYKTYHDFNRYILDKTINTKIDSIAFRQSIDNINKRIRNELGDIEGVIELKEKNSSKEINRYKWKIKI